MKRGKPRKKAGAQNRSATRSNATCEEILRRREISRLLSKLERKVRDAGKNTDNIANVITEDPRVEKFSRIVASKGLKMALRNALVRWIFARRITFPSDRDPLLPVSGGGDFAAEIDLASDVALTGVTPTESKKIALEILKESDEAVSRIREGSEALCSSNGAESNPEIVVQESQTCVVLTLAAGEPDEIRTKENWLFSVRVPKDFVDTMKARHTGNKECLLEDAFRVAIRYHQVTGGIGAIGIQVGLQKGLPCGAFRVLEESFGINTEAFASPYNATLPRYYSAFPDTDQVFGSLGSFYEAEPRNGCFEANPPFTEIDLARTAGKIIDWLVATENSTFVVIMPAWDDAVGVEALTDGGLADEKGLVAHPMLKLEPGKHFYRRGDTNDEREHKPSIAGTYVFFLQNAVAASQNPVTQQAVYKFKKAFQSFSTTVKARSRNGNRGKGAA